MDSGRDDARLSERERRILDEIEHALRDDEPLERSLRSMRGHWRVPGVRLPSAVVALLCAATVLLLVLAVATEAPALLWAFAAVWVLTAVSLLRAALGWAGRRLGRHSD
ncbi:DUF3040 domain-containing protein [Streptomyces tritici]|uniref:DUF3040 domain-containing protein n=1 Tax=Streptomyces tritici TaxID=2054410 RepID=UPI003AEFB605